MISDDGRYATGEWAYVTSTGFPHGLRCPECYRIIAVGQPYGQNLENVAGDGEAVVLLICVYCIDSGTT